MNITNVKTAVKVATIVKDDSNPKKLWNIHWDMTDKKILKDEAGRVYLLVVDGEIYKIGGSNCKGGIQKTISVYRDLALIGSPSVRTYGIHVLIKEQLDLGKNVEFYLISSDKVTAPVKGLFGFDIKEDVSIDYREIEYKCKEDYIRLEGNHPIWNFQERHESWPTYLTEGCNKLNSNTTKKAKQVLNKK